MSEHIKVKFDSATKKWFKEHPLAQTTVMQCETCGLFYKSILGHKCYIPSRHNSKPTQTDKMIMEEILNDRTNSYT